MGIMLTLSGIALRQVAEQALARAIGVSGGGEAIAFLTKRFTDHSQKLTKALQAANARSWESLEIALAGDSLWDRCKVALARAEDQAFREQVRAFLQASPLKNVRVEQRHVLPRALQELRSARARGALTAGSLAPAQLAQHAGDFARHSDPKALLDAEWAGVQRIAGDLRETYPHLCRVLLAKLNPNILAVAARYHFRRQIETDAELARGLAFIQIEVLQETQERAFAGLTEAVLQQRHRLEDMLGEIADILGETNAGVRELKVQMQQVLERLQFLNREVRPGDSLSLRSEDERQLVKSLVAKYRSLTQEERHQRPCLLSDVGKLGVVSGDFEAAQHDYEALATLKSDPKNRAEARHNAYRAALERRQWIEALDALKQAADLDAERFAPFPSARFAPLRILGAGGFGVVFLCQNQHRSTPVVIKSLSAAERGREIQEVFAEAEALDALDHPGIIRIGERGYADDARTRPYLVMDYFEGKNLADHVAEHGPLAEADLLVIARLVAEALRAAHGRGILHRDVKPANVLVRREAAEWKVKLIDFGLAVRITPDAAAMAAVSKTLLGASIAGTVGYAAPEQMGERPSDKVSRASDIYGFARTCCFALFQTPYPLPSQWARLSHQLYGVLEQCLKPAPNDRPADFAKVLELLAPPAPPGKPGSTAKDKLIFQLQGEEAAALDDFCAAAALAKMTEKYQEAKKVLAEKHARDRAVQHWFDGKARPDNPSLRTASSHANQIIKTGDPPTIPPQADGTPTPIKAWLLEQGIDQALADAIAANIAPQSTSTTSRIPFHRMLARPPEQQAAAKKLAGLLFEQLFHCITDIRFTDEGEQKLREMLDHHFSPFEQQMLQEPTTETSLPPDFLHRATSYCTRPEQLDQLLKIVAVKFYFKNMRYEGSFDRVTEALLSGNGQV